MYRIMPLNLGSTALKESDTIDKQFKLECERMQK